MYALLLRHVFRSLSGDKNHSHRQPWRAFPGLTLTLDEVENAHLQQPENEALTARADRRRDIQRAGCARISKYREFGGRYRPPVTVGKYR